MKRIELEVTDENVHGMFAISLVDRPAIESNWIMLRAETEAPMKFAADTEKRILTGPALIPNKPIYRVGPDGEEFEVVFRPDVVEALAFKYMREKRTDQVTEMHVSGVNGVYVVEAWIIADSDKDKAAALGMTLPVGTLMVSMKVDNDLVWQAAKDGEIKGYSIEAFLNMERVVMAAHTDPEDALIDAFADEIVKILSEE
jgi:hypothetical protein